MRRQHRNSKWRELADLRVDLKAAKASRANGYRDCLTLQEAKRLLAARQLEEDRAVFERVARGDLSGTVTLEEATRRVIGRRWSRHD